MTQVAAFFSSLRDSNSNLIPIIFRPFHEMDGNWFWWGTNDKIHNTPDDYKRLFHLTVHQLRDVEKVHNVLYVYSPSKTNRKENYLDYYPGDNSVDIFGYDYYYRAPYDPPISDLKQRLQHVGNLAFSKNKVAALTEIGISSSGLQKHHNFWIDHVLSPMSTIQNSSGFAYMMAWMNSCGRDSCETRVPYKGHPAANEFLRFYGFSRTLFGPHLKSISHHFPIVGKK